MTRLVQILMAGLLCCVMAFSAGAQQGGGKKGNPDGGKEPRGIPREPKGDKGNQGGGDRGNGDRGNRGNGDRGNRGNDGGGKPRRPDRPDDGF